MILESKKITGFLQVILGGALFGLVPIFVRFGNSVDALSLIFLEYSLG